MKIILPIPPSINRTYGVTRSGKIPFYKKKPVRVWEWTAGWEIKHQQGRNKQTFLGKIRLDIQFYYKRDRDIDSGLKVLLDLLQKQRIYLNDKQVVELYVLKYQDLIKPRVEVEIKEIM